MPEATKKIFFDRHQAEPARNGKRTLQSNH